MTITLARTGLALAALLTAGAGCADRSHLTRSHGRSVGAAMAAQVANPQAGERPRPVTGFDAQEASIVARSYRNSLAPKAPAREDHGMVILATPGAAPSSNLPPPSVPERK